MADAFDPPEHGPLSDSSTLWRLSLWGGAATVAVAATILVLNTNLGLDRVTELFSQSSANQQQALEENLKRLDMLRAQESQRLEGRIRELAADRDKLAARLATMEQNLSDLTGSIKRDMATITATTQSVKPSAPAPVAAPAPVSTATPEPARQAEAVAATVPSPSEATPDKQPQAAAVPIPPTRVAAAPPASPPEEPRKPELGIEIGGARSMEILQARWLAVKANFGPLIDGLRPLAGYDNRPGIIPYRLIVGPVPNGAAAAQICARFHASKVPCRTVNFAGEAFAQQ